MTQKQTIKIMNRFDPIAIENLHLSLSLYFLLEIWSDRLGNVYTYFSVKIQTHCPITDWVTAIWKSVRPNPPISSNFPSATQFDVLKNWLSSVALGFCLSQCTHELYMQSCNASMWWFRSKVHKNRISIVCMCVYVPSNNCNNNVNNSTANRWR